MRPAPVVLFSYANPICRMGFDAFAARAADAEREVARGEAHVGIFGRTLG